MALKYHCRKDTPALSCAVMRKVGPKTPTSSKAKRRPARKARRQVPEEVPEDDDMEGILPSEDERPVRVLKPSARFDSFVLWNPDIPADEEMDEYLRSLSEWVNIASEVRII
jgi:hypothetical protein